MIKGVDYTGISVVFFCHDGQGNFVMHKRGQTCRDERGRWDFGGGGLKFGERLEEALYREVFEEYGVVPFNIVSLGNAECFRKEEGVPTHWICFRYKVQVDREAVFNNEPEKHENVSWYTLDTLPTPLHSNIPEELRLFGDELRK